MTLQTSRTLLSVAILFVSSQQVAVADSNSLDQIVTSSTHSEESIHDLTGTVTVITSDQLEEKAIQTLPEALDRLAGIPMYSNGGVGKSTSVFLRGQDSKRVLLLVDGVRFNDPTGMTGANWQHLMVSDIERIEIIPGAQAGIWGADAGAGVINVITKTAGQGTHGSISYAMGTLGEKETKGSVSYGQDNFDARVSLQSLSTDGFSALTPIVNGQAQNPLDYEKDGYKNNTSNLKLGWNLGDKQRLELGAFSTEATSAYDGFSAPNDAVTHSTYRQNMGSLSYSRDILGWQTKFSTQAGKMHSENFNGSNVSNGTYDVDVRQNAIQTNHADSLGSWSLGSEWIEQNAHNMGTGTQAGNYNQAGTFVSRVQKFHLPTIEQPTVLNISLRNDDHNQYKSYVSKHIGLKQFWASEGYVALNFGDSQRSPNMYERFGPYTTTGVVPETVNSKELSVGYKGYSLTRFEDSVDNLIDFNLATYKYSNLAGTSQLSGWEWKAIQAIPSIQSELVLSYNVLDAKDKDGNTLARRPDNSGSASFTYLGLAHTHLSLQAQHVGSRLDGGYIGPQTGNYWLWHANASYQYTKQVRLFVKGINLTDERIMQATDSYMGSAPNNYYAYSPRTILTGVEFKF
jgi:vitamin B12 transporter